MPRSGGRDDDRLDFGVAQDRIQVARQHGARQLAGHAVELLLVEVADVLEVCVRQLVEVARQVLAPATHADDRDLNWIHAADHPLMAG